MRQLSLIMLMSSKSALQVSRFYLLTFFLEAMWKSTIQYLINPSLHSYF